MLLRSVLDLSPQDRERWIDASSAGDSKLRAQLRRAAPTGSDRARACGPRGCSDQRKHPSRRPLGSWPAHCPRPASVWVAMRSSICSASAAWAASIAPSTPVSGAKSRSRRLAEAFRGDSASLRRFEREARVLATLSHPNIATIYGFERLNGSPYLVLERVEGDTLAQRLARGRMPVHGGAGRRHCRSSPGSRKRTRKGVIHRDLKPSNVMLTRDGRVKLVDFGLAKTVAPARDAHEAAEPITVVGVVLGTARYMSPEQVMGEDVDARTDVWAFGCVLYEMLTGRPAFPGRSVSEVVAAVLRDDPDWRALPGGRAARHRSAAAPLPAPRSAGSPAAHRRRAPRAGRGGRRERGICGSGAPEMDAGRVAADARAGAIAGAAACFLMRAPQSATAVAAAHA